MYMDVNIIYAVSIISQVSSGPLLQFCWCQWPKAPVKSSNDLFDPTPGHDKNRPQLNSLAPGRSECDSKNVVFNLVLLIGMHISSLNNALWWMPQDLTDDKSTLVQVMLGSVRQQAITWASVDPDFCCHIASLGHNELMSLVNTIWSITRWILNSI